MYGIDIIALRWGIGIFVFFFLGWFIVAKILLKSEPKSVKVNLSDRYGDMLDKDLKCYHINSKEFKKMAFDKFVLIHLAFANGEYKVLEKNLTKDLYDYYVLQIENFKNRNERNVVGNIKLLNIKIFDVMNEHDLLRVNVYLNVRMFDYTLDNNNKCIKGNDKEEMDFEYEISFENKNTDNNSFVMSRKNCINNMLVVDSEKNKER